MLLLARLGLGVVLIAHGSMKVQDGLSGTAAGFESMGIPAPEVAAAFAITVELAGGILLVVGLLTPVVGILVALNMAGAFWFVHRGTEVLSSNGGWELVAVIGLLGVVLAAVGPGRWSLDRLFTRRSAEATPA